MSPLLFAAALCPALSFASTLVANANCTITSYGANIDGKDRAGESFTLSLVKDADGTLEVLAKGFGLESGSDELKMTSGMISAFKYGVQAGLFEHPDNAGEKILIGGDFELMELDRQSGSFDVQVETYRRAHADVYQPKQGRWESGMYWTGTTARCAMEP